ncbi:CapA family protein [Staphylococcus nepalensis]|uniref:CapA family protein n=1 Tax=Staphylococcus nepalensis TaxID=214473 RepID=UPI003EE42447
MTLSKSNHNVSFVGMGDNLIHPVVYKDAKVIDGSYDFKPMYKPIKSYVTAADVAFINQESPLGGDNKPYHGFKRFNTPSSVANDLTKTGFNLINGSNNHALDQGSDGLLNELKVWDNYKEKATFTGVFDSQKSYNKIPIKKVKGIKIALLSYTYGTNDIKPEKPYYIKHFNKKEIEKDVKKAKEKSDVIIVSAHWGKEGSHHITKKQKNYSKLFANLGVDAVIGTHPHVIQPMKWVEGKGNHKTLVAYSLGNFLNGQETGDESNMLLGSVNFDIDTKSENKIKNVKWKSFVNHFEMSDKNDKSSRQNFIVYPLHNYNSQLEKNHGYYNLKDYNFNKKNLKKITKDNIDEKFLEKNSL